MSMVTSFTYHFFRIFWHFRSINLTLFALIVINGWAISYVEKMPFGDAMFFAFITGLTIGYGDIVVKTPGGRILAVLVGFIGVLFSGLVVAAALRAVGETLKKSNNRG